MSVFGIDYESIGGGGHFAVGTFQKTTGDKTVSVVDVVTGEAFTPKGVMVSGGTTYSSTNYFTYLFCNTDLPKYGYGFKNAGNSDYTSNDSDTPNSSYNVQTTTNGFTMHSSGGAWDSVYYKYVAWD